LGTADGEGWDDDVAAAGHGFVDDGGQGLCFVVIFMVAVAVGGFHDDVVGGFDGGWVFDERLIWLAEVAGEETSLVVCRFQRPIFR
jgi:hypothetical protein